MSGYNYNEIIVERNNFRMISGSTVSNTDLSEFSALIELQGERELSECLSAYYLCAKGNSASFFAELNEFGTELSEFSLPKQYCGVQKWLRIRFYFFGVAQEPNRNRKPEPSEPFFPKPKAEPEPPEPFPGTETGTVLSF